MPARDDRATADRPGTEGGEYIKTRSDAFPATETARGKRRREMFRERNPGIALLGTR